jgi:hypothetical protein
MAVGTYSLNVTIAGVSVAKAVTREADHPNTYGPVTLPVAHALSSWVKTDADTAAGNLTAGHGLSTGTFDIYWDGGQRYDVPCTITTNAVALDGGTGTDFPASSDTTVRMSPQTQINTAIDGDEIELAFVSLSFSTSPSDQRGRIQFCDIDDDVIADLNLDPNDPLVYDIGGGQTNPFTGDPITYALASSSNVAETGSLSIASLEDSTP